MKESLVFSLAYAYHSNYYKLQYDIPFKRKFIILKYIEKTLVIFKQKCYL